MEVCPTCGKEFKTKYRRPEVKQRFCSKKCLWESRRITLTCKTCGKNFYVAKVKKNREYCSRECIERRLCKLCGRMIMGRDSMNGHTRIFCSRTCAGVFNRTLADGENYRVMGLVYTMLRRGRLECERCSFDDIAALEVHHIRGHEAGHGEDNLTTICANCHRIEHYRDAINPRSRMERAMRIVPIIAAQRRISASPNGQQPLPLDIRPTGKRFHFMPKPKKMRTKSPKLL
jgi:endogenous inhibitor of DNA gyrase (YacG/DUF329 family)